MDTELDKREHNDDNNDEPEFDDVDNVQYIPTTEQDNDDDELSNLTKSDIDALKDDNQDLDEMIDDAESIEKRSCPRSQRTPYCKRSGRNCHFSHELPMNRKIKKTPQPPKNLYGDELTKGHDSEEQSRDSKSRVCSPRNPTSAVTSFGLAFVVVPPKGGSWEVGVRALAPDKPASVIWWTLGPGKPYHMPTLRGIHNMERH